jgi:SAM-dependent methyltransferase
MTSDNPTRGRGVYPGILLLSAATLLLEVAWMRVLSVTLWYHFAFMALNTALFGFGFAGVVLALRRRANFVSSRFVAIAACLTPLAFFFGYAVFNAIPFEPFSLGKEARQWVFLPVGFLAAALPFFCSGLTIAGLLTRHAGAVHRLYGFDLAGAGLGALLVVWLLPVFGGSGTIFAAIALAAMGAALVSLEAKKQYVAFAVFLSLVFVVAMPFGDRLIPVRISHNKTSGDGVPFEKIFADPDFHKLTRWNTLSRVDVIEWRDRDGNRNRNALIDGGTAITRLAHPPGPVERLGLVNNDETFFVRLFEEPSVLVIGSGGGREVLLALRSRAGRVTAVEINPAINEIVSGEMANFCGHIYDDPRVRLYTDEARSFLRRSTESYDVIHCPHTISNAALSSGSLSLAENYLLTVEAFDDYMSRLSDNGVLLITRPEAHLPRLFSTARAALKGKPLENRVIAWRRPAPDLSFYAGFAFRQTPFSADEIKRFSALLGRLRLEALYLPGDISEEPYCSLARNVPLDEVPMKFPAILEPATDDKPFFNRRVSLLDIGWKDISNMFSASTSGRSALEDRPVAEVALLVLLAQTVVIALLFIIAPLIVFRRRGLEGAGRLWTLVAFSFLGLGYITVEVGLIQRLTLYLGKPTVVYATVLGTLLVSSGVGSVLSRRLSGRFSNGIITCGVAVVVFVIAALLPPLLGVTLAWPEPARILLAIVMLVGPGLAMGMPFPLLIAALKKDYPERIPWAFGVNGFASVVGTLGAVLIAMTVGQTLVLFVGVACYLLAMVGAFRMSS